MLDLYRSFDLDELKPYQKEIPGAKLVLLDGVRHFLFEDEPGRCADEVIAFLQRASN